MRLPAYQHLSDLRLKLCPKILPYPLGSSGAAQRGVCTDLKSAVILVLCEGLVAWLPRNWISSCSETSLCQNLVARIFISADGRGDEKQYAQKSQGSMDTSHAFSLVWSLTSIHLAMAPQDENEPSLATETRSLYTEEVLFYDSKSVLPAARQKLDDEEDGVRVWFVPSDLEEDLKRANLKRGSVEELEIGGDKSKLARREGPGVGKGFGCDEELSGQNQGEQYDDPEVVSEEEEEGKAVTEEALKEQDLRQRFRELRKPMGFQKLGQEVYKDHAPQSSRAQCPWLLAHQRENLDTVREMMETIVDPAVEELRSHSLISGDVMDLRTGYMTVVGTGVKRSSIVDGLKVEWEEKVIVEVPKEESRTAHLGNVPVRRTSRLRGNRAGRKGDQARVEDLSRPLLIICSPCGHLQSISADLSMGGLDTKMIRLINQRTGAYCYCCSATVQEANDPAKVKEGFEADMPMERVLELAREMFEEAGVPADQQAAFELVAQRGDEKTRQANISHPIP